jgi:N-omega-hydroxy-L-arginine synthase
MHNTLENPSWLVIQGAVQYDDRKWHRDVLQDLQLRLGDLDFPCPFSKNAFQKSLLRFIFVESDDAQGLKQLAAGLRSYVEISRHWDGSLNTAYPLVVAFSIDVAGRQSLESYHDFGWKILQRLHDIDLTPWPIEVGTDPETASWSMCFNGMPLFCNMSSPAHELRRSRNLGNHFIIIINPRERFDVVAGDTTAGRKVRSNIRSRIAHYDGTPHSPQLASYGAGSIEWKQYGILEENVDRADRCPFKFSH